MDTLPRYDDSVLHRQIHEARVKANLPLARLAKLSGVHRSRLQKFEQEGENITLDSLRKIVAHLPVTQLTLGSVDIIPKNVDANETGLQRRSTTVGKILQVMEDADEAKEDDRRTRDVPAPVQAAPVAPIGDARPGIPGDGQARAHHHLEPQDSAGGRRGHAEAVEGGS